uniref:Chromo domain-containing protein n=1 Tax=Magallana gigas TaxID=29159 RepID=A0A8W8KUK6_MAGGI
MALSNQQNSPSPARFEEKSQGRDHRDRYQGYRANNFQPRNNFHGNRQYQNSGPQYRERPRPAHGTHGNRFPRPAHQSRDTSSQHSNRPSQFQHPPGPKNSCTNVQNEGQTQNDAQNLDEENQIDPPPSSDDDTQDENEIDQFPFDIRKLLKYRHKDQHFRIEWTDGTKSWEPQENVRPDLVQQYFEKYTKKGRLRKK